MEPNVPTRDPAQTVAVYLALRDVAWMRGYFDERRRIITTHGDPAGDAAGAIARLDVIVAALEAAQ